MQESGRRLGPERVDGPNPAGELLPDCRDESQKRFSCPYCGQHYSIGSVLTQHQILCLSCGKSFLPQPAASEPGGGAPISSARTTPAHRFTARIVSPPGLSHQPPPDRLLPLTPKAAHAGLGLDVLALFTPLIMTGAMSVGLLASKLAIVVSPVVGYLVSIRLCRQVLKSTGTAGLQRYLRGSVMSFILWGLLAFGAVFLGERWLNEGAGLLLFPLWVLAEIALLFVFIVWGWSASTVWSSATGDEGPSWPGY